MDTSWIGTCSYGHLLLFVMEENKMKVNFQKRREMKRKRE